jgi:hypothetical protein
MVRFDQAAQTHPRRDLVHRLQDASANLYSRLQTCQINGMDGYRQGRAPR